MCPDADLDIALDDLREGEADERCAVGNDLRDEDLELLRLLPRSLSAGIGRLHGSQLVGEVLDAVKDELLARLHGAPLTPVEEGRGPSIAPWQRAPMCRVRHALSTMGRDKSLAGRVTRAGQSARHNHHVWRFYSEIPRDIPATLPHVLPPKNGPWFAQADLGLGCSTYLEAMPDAVSSWIAQGVIRGRARATVLHIGAGPSGIAAAIDVLAPKRTRFRVHEVDPAGPEVSFRDPDEAPYRCLVSRSRVIPTDVRFRVVVLHAASPAGPGAVRHRDHYGPKHGLLDNGRMAYRNWLPATLADTLLAIGRVMVGGYLILYLPLGIRMPDKYLVEHGALDWFNYVLGQMPLAVLRSQTVVEVSPARQPFVGTQRCPWQVIVARKTGRRAAP